MKTLTWQKPGQQNVAQELIKIIINYVAELRVDKVAIAFTRDNNLPATFEIQLSGGGGQFLTVYSGTVSEYGKLISYPFKGTTASDLRIVLNDDRVSIAEVKF